MVDKDILNYVKNKESTTPLKYIYAGVTPSTKDILNNMKMVWYGYTDNSNKVISVDNLFKDKNDQFNFNDIKYFHISINIPLLNDIKLNVNIEDVLNISEVYTQLEVSTKVYEYAIKYIKGEYPKASIFFESLSQIRTGEYYEF